MPVTTGLVEIRPRGTVEWVTVRHAGGDTYRIVYDTNQRAVYRRFDAASRFNREDMQGMASDVSQLAVVRRTRAST
jgi:hypothetical protein